MSLIKKVFYKTLVLQFFVLWVLAVIIPKEQYKTIFVSEIMVFFVVFVINIRKIRTLMFASKQGYTIWCLFGCFFAIAALMLYVSYKNIPTYWNIWDLYYERSYISRHFMVIAELFLSIGLGFSLMKTGLIYKINKKTLAIIAVLLGVIILYNQNYVIFLGGLFVAVLSLLSFKLHNKLFLLLIPLVMVSHSAYIIASAFMLSLLFFRNSFKRFFSYHPTRRILLLLALSIFAIIIFRDDLYKLIRSDGNSYWRLLVWTNEIETLAKTYFTGVGFGTAYVTSNIDDIVNNFNMYIDSEGDMYERLFLVANHNSVLNMFYRLGLLGGSLFVAWNIMVCSFCLFSFKMKILGENSYYCWWAFTNYIYNLVIIFLNPGMEMMQFAINYTFSLGVVFAVIFSSHLTLSREKNIKEGRAIASS